jgi:hypothetical protein
MFPFPSPEDFIDFCVAPGTRQGTKIGQKKFSCDLLTEHPVLIPDILLSAAGDQDTPVH